MTSITITSTSSSNVAGPVTGGSTTAVVGGYTTDATALPFINEQDIGVYASGMKPSTQLYVFFDGKLMTSYVTQATLDFTISNPQVTDFNSAGSRGANTFSDTSGNFAAIMHIPAGTFFTGARLVVIADVNNLNNLDVATTSASYTFNAFNFTTTTTTDASVISTIPTSTSSGQSSDPSTAYTSTIQNLAPAQSTTSATQVSPANTSAALPQVNGTLAASNSNFSSTNWSITLNNLVDPIAQAFLIGSDGLSGADGVYVTSLDLFFESKDPIQGITVDIRTMQNGSPTNTVVPLSKIHLAPSNISTSTNGSAATHIQFPSPIFLASGLSYAIGLTPDGNNPNYSVFTAVVGQTDLNTNQPITSNWGSGNLFTSTNAQTWVPVTNEFMKFNLNIATFNYASANVYLVNKDYEFLVPSNTSGWFEQGEYVFQNSSNVCLSNTGNPQVVVNASSYTVSLLTTNSTSNLSSLSTNSSIVVSNGSVYNVLFVNTVANATSITVKNLPTFVTNTINTTATDTSIKFTPVGKVVTYDPYQYDLTLVDSTANSSSYFASGNTVIGSRSGASSAIFFVRDRVINRFQPYLYTTAVQSTALQFSMQNVIANTYSNTTLANYDLTKTNYVVDNEISVASKSNEIVHMSGQKSLKAILNMSTINNLLSPSLNVPHASIIGVKNIINSNSSNENTKAGSSVNRYISQTVTLSANLDSDDLNVYITAYKPANTYINVYGKFLNSSDPDTFDSKDWTLLNQDTSSAVISDPVNLSDVKEFQFSVPSSPPSVSKTGILTTSSSSNTITGFNTSFTTDVQSGNLIKIYSDSSQVTFQIAKVTSVANNTSLTIDNNAAFTSVTATYSVITTPHTAFINSQNYNALRYYSNTGVAYDSYITYAIKIDLLADTSYRVPRVLNIRSVAVV